MALNIPSLRSMLRSLLEVLTANPRASTDTINEAGALIRKTDGVLETVATKKDSITQSKVLSDEGKNQANAELANATASSLGFEGRKTDGWAQDITNMEEQLFAVKPPADLTDSRAREIRDQYRGRTQNEVDAAFVTATQGDADEDQADAKEQARRDAVAFALLDAPGMPMVTEAIRDAALDERARRLNPETYTRLAQVRMLHDLGETLRGALIDWLQSLGGDKKIIRKELGGSEPVSPMEAARKMVNA